MARSLLIFKPPDLLKSTEVALLLGEIDNAAEIEQHKLFREVKQQFFS